MKKTVMVGSLILALATAQSAWAASASVSGKTYALTGKFSGSGSFNCSGIPAQKVPIQKQRNISATIAFSEDGKFVWSGDSLYPFESTGEWSQSGSKVELDFDNPTTMSYLQRIGEQQASGYANGATGSATVSPSKYGFSAKVKSGGNKLTITETGGYKIKADASAKGFSASCKFKLSLTRTYTGKPL